MSLLPSSRRSASKWAELKPQSKKRGLGCTPGLVISCCLVLFAGFLLALVGYNLAVAWDANADQSEDKSGNTATGTATKNLLARAVESEAEPQPDRCNLSRPAPAKLPTWLPSPGKFFLAWCHLYGWSNRMYCTERALVLAALLNRTLIIPSIDVCVNTTKGNTMDLMIDVAHVRRCILSGYLKTRGASLPSHVPEYGGLAGGERESSGQEHETEDLEMLRKEQQVAEEVLLSGLYVISLPEYLSLHDAEKLHVDLLICEGHEWYGHCPPPQCSAADQVTFPEPMQPPMLMYNSSANFQLTLAKVTVLSEVTESATVLSTGDTFYGNVDEYRIDEQTPLAPLFDTPCGLLFQPAADIFRLAAEFRSSQLNESQYAALHWRRKDFADHCGGAGKCTFWSIEQSAECVIAAMSKAGLKLLFVASDAYADELRKLQGFLSSSGIELRMFLPETRRSWFESSLVEKVIAAQSDLFIAQDQSTFSYHIQQIRNGLGKATCHDGKLCAGQDPGFIPGATLS